MTLLLLLSFKGSLAKWHEAGILTREIEIYVAHLRMGHFDRIMIYTYGNSDEQALDSLGLPPELRARISLARPRLGGAGRIGALIHSIDYPLMRRLRRQGADLVKTNQISGGWAALVARAAGIPVFARCGYILSRRLEKNGQRAAAFVARALERALFGAARLVTVTTEGAKDDLAQMIGEGTDKIHVSPTYVDTELFDADPAARTVMDELVFIGRLEPQKNVLAIVEACRLAEVRLVIVGDGSLRADVMALADRLGVPVSHAPRMQNNAIAAVFRTHAFYILASIHEGLPKSLIEAMSSGMICIGTNVPGISDLIIDGETGFLAAGVEPEAVATAIRRALSSGSRGQEIGSAARAHILANHSVATYARREIELIESHIRPRSTSVRASGAA